MEEIWEKFKEDLKAACHKPDDYLKIMSKLNDGLDDFQIKAFEKELGMKLPSDYKEFLTIHNGGTSVFNTFKLDSTEDILKSIENANDLLEDGYRIEYKKGHVPTEKELEVYAPDENSAGLNYWSKYWIPFASNGNLDSVCYDTQHHEVVLHISDKSEVVVLASSFADYFKKESAEFLKNVDKTVEEIRNADKSWIMKLIDKVLGK